MFLDDCPGLSISPLRASGQITPAMTEAEVLVGSTKGRVKLAHTRFPHGGGYSYFVCPRCEGLARVIREHEGALKCRRCLKEAGRWRYRAEANPRLKIERLAKLVNGPCPRVKGKDSRHTVDRKGKLTATLRKLMLRERARAMGAK